MLSFDGSVFAFALALAAVIGGTTATYSYDPRSAFGGRLVTGACTGFAALGVVGFALAMRLGLTPQTLVLSGLIVSSPALLFVSRYYRRAFRTDFARLTVAELRTIGRGGPGAFVRAGLCVLAAAALWLIADRAMFVRDDGIYTGITHNLGDLPFHLSIINRFVVGGNFPPEHPSYAGVGFTYPYLTDFISGMFVRAGMDVRSVIVWSTVLLLVMLAVLMYRLTLDLTADRTAAFIAPALMFLSGGLGWWMFLAEAVQSDSTVRELLARLPHDYTITYDNQFRWGNLITTLLVPQRGLLLGLPLALIVFDNWWHATSPDEQPRRVRQARMIAAGVITGLLPLIHAHTFAVVVGVGGLLGLLSRRRWEWLLFVAWALALGLPQILWLGQSSGINTGRFIEWSVGWDRGNQNVISFWLKNTGLLLPLVAVALLWRGNRPLVSRRLLIAYLPFTLCFIIPNMFRLAPWIWDNIKILVYWFIASVPLVALLLARLAQGRWWRKAVAALLFLSLTLAGGLDLWRVASRSIEARIFDHGGVQFAAVVARVTPAKALILHAPTYNHPVILSGRRSFMGYPGHVWSHGLDGGPREADIKGMFAGGADATALLTRYGIDYVVVGPAEADQLPVNRAFFERYPLAGEAGGYRLYRTSGVQN